MTIRILLVDRYLLCWIDVFFKSYCVYENLILYLQPEIVMITIILINHKQTIFIKLIYYEFIERNPDRKESADFICR